MSDICDNKSVGMLVWKEGALLLIERKKEPFGFAPPAGHVDDDPSFEISAKRELKEEVGLDAENTKLLIEGKKENRCRRKGGDYHYWKIYEVKSNGKVQPSLDETKGFGFYSKKQIKALCEKTKTYLEGEMSEGEWEKSPGIEPVWCEWFKKLNII